MLLAYLFGSYALGEESSLSDIDIAIFVAGERGLSFQEKLFLQGDIICDGNIIYNCDQDLLGDFKENPLLEMKT